MKCTDCVNANWNRTASGRLHPDGSGKCTVKWEMPPLPACMYWIGQSAPVPNGGYIDRRDELKTPCHYYRSAQ